MIKKQLLMALFFAITFLGYSQSTPELINYQSVIRDASNNVLANSTISVKFEIKQNDPTSGTLVFSESHTSVTTNGYGMFNLQIGGGATLSGDFTTIGWDDYEPYYLLTYVDIAGGTAYTYMGANQFLSVPYALHAQTAESITDPNWVKVGDKQYSALPMVGIGNNDPTVALDIKDETLNDTKASALKIVAKSTASGSTWTDAVSVTLDSNINTPNGASAVYAESTGTNAGYNRGVWGEALGSSVTNRGVQGVARGVEGSSYGTVGYAQDASAGINFGAAGYASNGNGGSVGVYGNTNTTDGLAYGVYGVANGVLPLSYNTGVYGKAEGGGTGNIGVSGYTIGVAGENIGTQGRALGSTTGVNLGVKGTANGAVSENDGLLGETTGNANYNVGVYGSASGINDKINHGLEGYADQSTTTNIGVVGNSVGSGVDNYGVKGFSFGLGGTNYYGVYGETSASGGNYFAGYFKGDVNITGNLNVLGNISKGGGTFKIDHPEDPANKYLVHSFVESPEMMNVYNGNTKTDANGFSTVELPSYFDKANKECRYQLTVIGVFAQAIIKKKVSGNTFVIQTNQPNVEVSWQVTGIRADKWANENRVVPELEKKKKGTYLHPELFGQPKEKTEHYHEPTKLSKERKEKRKSKVYDDELGDLNSESGNKKR